MFSRGCNTWQAHTEDLSQLQRIIWLCLFVFVFCNTVSSKLAKPLEDLNIRRVLLFPRNVYEMPQKTVQIKMMCAPFRKPVGLTFSILPTSHNYSETILKIVLIHVVEIDGKDAGRSLRRFPKLLKLFMAKLKYSRSLAKTKLFMVLFAIFK